MKFSLNYGIVVLVLRVLSIFFCDIVNFKESVENCFIDFFSSFILTSVTVSNSLYY